MGFGPLSPKRKKRIIFQASFRESGQKNANKKHKKRIPNLTGPFCLGEFITKHDVVFTLWLRRTHLFEISHPGLQWEFFPRVGVQKIPIRSHHF